MKVLTILGTRPEIIRLSIIISKLDEACNHVLVHTGQNFDRNLNDIFFQQLKVRKPDYFLGVKGATFGEQIGKILIEGEKVLRKEHPDAVVILGDTNSGLLSVIAKRLGIPVYHLEAGNRCYDSRVPEETNRRVIDHSSTVLMPYTNRSKENLLQEGIENHRIFVIGNPIYEVINKYLPSIDKSEVFNKYGVEKKEYFLLTMHRAENVDDESRLSRLLEGIDKVQQNYKKPIICSCHPRTRSKLEHFKVKIKNDNITFLDPLGFFDFVALEKHAFCVLSDSGTVQEECCILKIPNVTIRDVTERPETIECGSNILSGVDPQRILDVLKLVVNKTSDWIPPSEYLVPYVSDIVVKIIAGYSKVADNL
ncbi:MAG: UDP-N-acetylglucosamine 2-epimerase (non-hydrolyzing) [Candidatus Omnitrophica bacterium]|nr:UDP-N-acetylglucosamine 2-epimerase (non-hydrolyzing) [Candidatus Omnitrophota bacterium]